MKKIKNILDDEGRNLPVMEYFLSLQGEGYHTGLASFFIRIGGCDVGCHWCDVKESWNPEIHPLTEVDKLVAKIPAHIKTVIITGGEPTLYNLSYLTRRLKAMHKNIHLETSGTGNLSGDFDWICLSPKKNELPQPDYYRVADELKMIVYNRSDFDFAEAEAGKLKNLHTQLYLQPEWSRKKTMIPEIIRYIEQHPQWKISLQTHKYLKTP